MGYPFSHEFVELSHTVVCFVEDPADAHVTMGALSAQKKWSCRCSEQRKKQLRWREFFRWCLFLSSLWACGVSVSCERYPIYLHGVLTVNGVGISSDSSEVPLSSFEDLQHQMENAIDIMSSVSVFSLLNPVWCMMVPNAHVLLLVGTQNHSSRRHHLESMLRKLNGLESEQQDHTEVCVGVLVGKPPR